MSTVRARHAFRLDANGKPKEKTFPKRVWDQLGSIHQWVDGQQIKHPKMGWVEIGFTSGQQPPAPLKEVAQPTPPPATELDPEAPLPGAETVQE